MDDVQQSATQLRRRLAELDDEFERATRISQSGARAGTIAAGAAVGLTLLPILGVLGALALASGGASAGLFAIKTEYDQKLRTLRQRYDALRTRLIGNEVQSSDFEELSRIESGLNDLMSSKVGSLLQKL